MNDNERQLSYPFDGQEPAAGYALTVAEGVKWIKMPLPFALNHINLWLLKDVYEGKEGWAIVDCGIAKDPVKSLWEEVFTHELEELPVTRVIVTHMHPDHVGLAGWLCAKWQVPLFMSMTDYMVSRLWTVNAVAGAGTGGDMAVAHFARHGLTDPESQEKIRARATYYPGLVSIPPTSFHRLVDGQSLQIGPHSWELISGYGHAPEHMALFCKTLNVLISGDMILPKISTNISVFDYEPEANPLPLYLDSLHKYAHLPEDVLVLPSHGRPFVGVHERIRQQFQHHDQRLAEVLAMCTNPVTVTEIVPMMFKRELDLHQLTFAMGEALAHLHALYFDGKLKREVSADGVYRFVIP
ncbi:MBL fold metallo-hydrolase [Pelistega europaea]|uniref:MBL fold metallo-hydrolase n=1 Tax=Pelistega europaea TaxID=106147 RepID=A0A7Y4L7U8_9BURK|nr:MBL fold metallo-hydrolase [Pelistega europaea]NOL48610.1 MBL fold metallo-hydrolase [Pelistega europaea]